jgi:hypothetical protein
MIKKLKDIGRKLLEQSLITTTSLIALKKLNNYYTLAIN